VKPIFESHNHLLLYPVQYEGMELSPNIVYLGAAPNQQIVPAVKWCCGFLKKKRLFLVGSDYVFPRTANAILRDMAKAEGAQVVGEEYLLLGSTDVATVIKKIQETKPDILLNTINGDSNVAFLRSLRQAGLTSEVLPTLSLSLSEADLGSFSAKQVQGDYAAWNYFQSIPGEPNQTFVENFRQRFGQDRAISDPMESAYSGVHLWAKAVSAAQSDDPIRIREAIKGQQFDGPGGKITIDPTTQHASKQIRIGQVTAQGQFKIVFASDMTIVAEPYPPSRTKEQWQNFLIDLQLRWGGKWANPGK
jgi:urea transport system substrate-binding protein